MADVFTVFKRTWYGPGTADYHWQLFAVYGSAEKAKAAIERLNDEENQCSRPRRLRNRYQGERKPAYTYQRNMVL